MTLLGPLAMAARGSSEYSQQTHEITPVAPDSQDRALTIPETSEKAVCTGLGLGQCANAL